MTQPPASLRSPWPRKWSFCTTRTCTLSPSAWRGQSRWGWDAVRTCDLLAGSLMLLLMLGRRTQPYIIRLVPSNGQPAMLRRIPVSSDTHDLPLPACALRPASALPRGTPLVLEAYRLSHVHLRAMPNDVVLCSACFIAVGCLLQIQTLPSWLQTVPSDSWECSAKVHE